MTKVLPKGCHPQRPRASGFVSKPANGENDNAPTCVGGFLALFCKVIPTPPPAGSAGGGVGEMSEHLKRMTENVEGLPEHLTP